MPKIKWLVLPIMIKTTNFFFNFLKVLFLRLIILEKVKNLTSAKKKFFNSPKLPLSKTPLGIHTYGANLVQKLEIRSDDFDTIEPITVLSLVFTCFNVNDFMGY